MPRASGTAGRRERRAAPLRVATLGDDLDADCDVTLSEQADRAERFMAAVMFTDFAPSIRPFPFADERPWPHRRRGVQVRRRPAGGPLRRHVRGVARGRVHSIRRCVQRGPVRARDQEGPPRTRCRPPRRNARRTGQRARRRHHRGHRARGQPHLLRRQLQVECSFREYSRTSSSGLASCSRTRARTGSTTFWATGNYSQSASDLGRLEQLPPTLAPLETARPCTAVA